MLLENEAGRKLAARMQAAVAAFMKGGTELATLAGLAEKVLRRAQEMGIVPEAGGRKVDVAMQGLRFELVVTSVVEERTEISKLPPPLPKQHKNFLP